MKKSLFICILIVLATLTCCERKLKTPTDPDFIDDNLLPPDSLQIKVVDEDVLELSWVDICKIEDSFQIFRKTGTGTYSLIKTLPANSSSWQDENISLGNRYTYQVYAVYDNYKPPNFAESSFDYTLYPPTNLGIEALSGNRIKLSWESANIFAEGYKIDAKLKTGDWQLNFASVASNTNSWEYNLTESDSLIAAWRVKAYYKSFYGANSEEVLQKVAEPNFNPAGGIYTSSQSVTINCATSGATIRYTTDGSTPTSSSTLYSAAIQVSENTNIKAKAFLSGWIDSETVNASYSIFNNGIYVSGGTFHNGTSNVTLSSFYISKYETTQSEYQAVMGTNPSYFGGNPNHPVERVSWFNAVEYCNRRSMQEGLTPCYSYGTNGTNPSNWPSGWNTNRDNHINVSCNWTANGYRLPTEMEWMFAAKGGNQSQGYTYSGSNNYNAVAWHSSNSGSTTHTVGTKRPNELGIYDMSGNVWEWCWDIYGSYPSSSSTNPHGATSGSVRVVRGGSWYYHAVNCNVSYRIGYAATYGNGDIGFRCVRVSL
ncbi:MAG: SUMF1/EgtB/PvdO family nonheme iron enzyme [Candidatus Cloacimonetes bacterium]|nr:SUMF1/EgtB/PvdO family nonheme iron enzyme [Candidatus Cloacimonadota bacterium]